MVSIFSHRRPAPVAKSYRKFRDAIREDFHECCAYCLLHEIVSSGHENFELDHHRPKHVFPGLVAHYRNIYYACHVCNHRKGKAWPSKQMIRRGRRFVNPCRECFSQHFREEDNGFWTPLTPAAEYTADRIQLNRKHLLDVRAWLIATCDAAGRPRINWDRPTRTQLLSIIQLGYQLSTLDMPP
jgi:hypothetical protein